MRRVLLRRAVLCEHSIHPGFAEAPLVRMKILAPHPGYLPPAPKDFETKIVPLKPLTPYLLNPLNP